VQVEVDSGERFDVSVVLGDVAGFEDDAHRATAASVQGRARPATVCQALLQSWPGDGVEELLTGCTVESHGLLPDGATGDEAGRAALLAGDAQDVLELLEPHARRQHGPRTVDGFADPATALADPGYSILIRSGDVSAICTVASTMRSSRCWA
jgi:hypothetical protein